MTDQDISNAKISYSQTGEDIIVDSVFNILGMNNITYLDVGAYDPVYINNTYYYYKKGCRGVCIEPDPELCKKIREVRKEDTVLNAGVGTGETKTGSFYIMSSKTLNTFSKEQAQYLVDKCFQRIESITEIPMVNINDVIKQYFNVCPDLISLDVEGLELDILATLDFTNYRPRVFCIETLEYAVDNSGKKNEQVIRFMNENKYFVYADTYINTIFVDAMSFF